MIVTPAVMYGPPSFSQWVTSGSVPRFASPPRDDDLLHGPGRDAARRLAALLRGGEPRDDILRRRLQPDRQVPLARKQVRHDRERCADDVLEHDDRQATIAFEAPLHGRQLPPRAHLPRNPGQQLGACVWRVSRK